MGVTQIINGLENPVKNNLLVVVTIFKLNFQLVVNEVAHKFAQSHFTRGVREKNVRLLTKIIIDYVQVNQSPQLYSLYRQFTHTDMSFQQFLF